MKHTNPFITALAILTIANVAACSGSTSSGDNVSNSNVDLSFSDAPVDGAEEVVIAVESVTFRGNGDDIVVDTFTSEALGLQDAESFSLDLLTVQGEDRRLVIDSVELPVGDYSNMLIDVADEDASRSYVTEIGGARKELKVPSDQLKLGGFTISPVIRQSMVVEFGLEQSMTYNPGAERYILKPRGVRILSLDQASQITGMIDHVALVNDGCSALETGGVAGSLHLYPAQEAANATLADNFDPETAQGAGAAVAPYASVSLDQADFVFSYLEPGSYVLAVACGTIDDDPAVYQPADLTIPNPTDQQLPVTLAPGERLVCTVPLAEGVCRFEDTANQGSAVSASND